MKKHVFLLALVCLFVTQINGAGEDLDPSLIPLKPLLDKTWVGILKAPDGSAEFEVTRTFEMLDGGKVIRLTKINKDLNGYGEGFIHWNDIEQKAAFFFIEKSGAFLKGFVTAGNGAITFEGQMTWPKAMPQGKQTYDFKNTFEVKSETEMVDSWFHNAFGPWRPGHRSPSPAGKTTRIKKPRKSPPSQKPSIPASDGSRTRILTGFSERSSMIPSTSAFYPRTASSGGMIKSGKIPLSTRIRSSNMSVTRSGILPSTCHNREIRPGSSVTWMTSTPGKESRPTGKMPAGQGC